MFSARCELDCAKHGHVASCRGLARQGHRRHNLAPAYDNKASTSFKSVNLIMLF